MKEVAAEMSVRSPSKLDHVLAPQKSFLLCSNEAWAREWRSQQMGENMKGWTRGAVCGDDHFPTIEIRGNAGPDLRRAHL